MSPLALSLRLLQTQPDSRLLALAKDGHEAAFEALVRRYRRELLAYSQRVSNGVAAEDVLQQALLQAWSALGSGAQVKDARAWLYRIVHNAGVSAARSAGERPSALVETAAVYGVEQVVEQRLAAREALTHLAALPELQREVMLGSVLEGRSHEELANELGLSGGSVRGLIYRARAALRTAAAAVIPTPVVDWAIRNGAALRAGPAYEALVGGGSVGVAGALVKGGVAATFVGALAGAAVVVGNHHHVAHVPPPQAGRPTLRHAARDAAGPRSGTFLLASVVEPASAADQPQAGLPEARRGPGVAQRAAARESIAEAQRTVRRDAPRRVRATNSISEGAGSTGSAPGDRGETGTQGGANTNRDDTSGEGGANHEGGGGAEATSASAGPVPQASGTGGRTDTAAASGQNSALPSSWGGDSTGQDGSNWSGSQGGYTSLTGGGSTGAQSGVTGSGSLSQPVPTSSGDR